MANQFPQISKINRETAIKEGKKVYLSGTPCKKCGTNEKHVSSYSCVKCNIERNLSKLYDKELMVKYRTKEKYDLYWENNKDKKIAKQKRYSESEKGIITNNAKAARRRSRVKNQLPNDADFDIIKQIYEDCRKLSIETGVPHEVDHIVPIAEGGLHHQDNLQILTRTENRKKSSKLIL